MVEYVCFKYIETILWFKTYFIVFNYVYNIALFKILIDVATYIPSLKFNLDYKIIYLSFTSNREDFDSIF
jgi:hypothetical protein